MSEEKGKYTGETKPARDTESENMPRDEATQRARDGEWGQPEENDERFGHSPAAGESEESDNKN